MLIPQINKAINELKTQRERQECFVNTNYAPFVLSYRNEMFENSSSWKLNLSIVPYCPFSSLVSLYSLWSIVYCFFLCFSPSLRAHIIRVNVENKAKIQIQMTASTNGKTKEKTKTNPRQLFVLKWMSWDSGDDDCVNAFMSQCFIRSTRVDWQTNWLTSLCMWHWHEIFHFQCVLGCIDCRHSTIMPNTLCSKANRNQNRKLNTIIFRTFFFFFLAKFRMHKTFLVQFNRIIPAALNHKWHCVADNLFQFVIVIYGWVAIVARRLTHSNFRSFVYLSLCCRFQWLKIKMNANLSGIYVPLSGFSTK